MSLTDLHICKEPTLPSSDTSSSGLCDCPPEYCCVDICGEADYSVSTVISWQHFPRSTSSRSRCNESSEEGLKSITDTLTPIQEEVVESSKPSTTEYPITKSFAQLKALHYLEIRHVFEFLNFLLGHLVCNEPEDPVSFLDDLLEKCLNFRDFLGEPPLLFTKAHVKSLYAAFDAFDRGHLTLDQYREAMRSLGLADGITPCDEAPPVNDDGCVEQDDFLFEAERCLAENLRQMLRIPKLWEENRLAWKRKMDKLRAKSQRKESEFEEAFDSGGSERRCRCSAVKSPNLSCHCMTQVNVANEPEQLFLDECAFLNRTSV